jgi:uncharacterized membrane protein
MACYVLLQCVAVCCSVLQCVALLEWREKKWIIVEASETEAKNGVVRTLVLLQSVAVCCSVLQCVALLHH